MKEVAVFKSGFRCVMSCLAIIVLSGGCIREDNSLVLPETMTAESVKGAVETLVRLDGQELRSFERTFERMTLSGTPILRVLPKYADLVLTARWRELYANASNGTENWDRSYNLGEEFVAIMGFLGRHGDATTLRELRRLIDDNGLEWVSSKAFPRTEQGYICTAALDARRALARRFTGK